MGNFKESGMTLNNLGYVPPGQLMDQQLPLDRERFPDQNEYKYEPNANPNVFNANQILTYNGPPGSENISANQVPVSGSGNQGIKTFRSGAEKQNSEDQNEDDSKFGYLKR